MNKERALMVSTLAGELPPAQPEPETNQNNFWELDNQIKDWFTVIQKAKQL